jgi:hypothetical protein
MSLRRCPACKNMIAAETIICPVCGVDPKRRQIVRVIKWIIVLCACTFGLSRMVGNHSGHSPAAHATGTGG